MIDASSPVADRQVADAGTAVEPVLQRAGRGTLLLDGGGVMSREVASRIIAYSGTAPRLCLIDTADEGGGGLDGYFDAFEGVQLVAVDVEVSNIASDAVVGALRDCTGYFFGGGAPQRLSDIFRPGGRDSPALAAIRERYEQNGALIAGGSAGAMIVGPITLCECGASSSVVALAEGNLFQAPGFDLIGPVLIDAHFFARGLLGRHLVALARNGLPLGIGIDEGTAVVVPGDGGPWQVIGDGQIAVIVSPPGASEASLRDFRLSVLSPGDIFDPVAQQVQMAAARRPVPAQDAGTAEPLRLTRIFSPGVIPAVIRELYDSAAAEVVGYDNDNRVALSLRKGDRTAAFDDGANRSTVGILVSVERL